jgi:hypothetical protein
MADTASEGLKTKSSTGGTPEDDKREVLDKHASPER